MRRTLYAARLQALLRRWPIVTIVGPRQCGKTTFVRRTLPGWTYQDLERPSHVAPLAADPEARLEQLGDAVIFDEAHHVPSLFPVLRGIIDRQRTRKGRYVLLGSAAPSLAGGVSESLAGRTAFLDLPPFRWDEVRAVRPLVSLAELWLRGGFPDAFLARSDTARAEWHESYTRAFIERDLPGLGVDVSSAGMRRLWTMLAHLNGTLWNASQVAASLGVSYHTVNRYVDILEQTYLVRKLSPFFANIGKRLVKSPKIYFRDTGLLHGFVGITTLDVLDTHPSRALSWEAFVIDQLVSAFERFVPDAQAYFWRTAAGREVDLLIDRRDRRVPIEIKIHTAPTPDDARGVLVCMKDLRLSRGYVVHGGRESYALGEGVTAVAARSLLRDPRSVTQL